LTVRKITDVLRLKEAGFSARQIAESLACARSTVGDTLSRASVAALTYEQAQGLSEAELYARLYPGNTGSPRRRAEPDYEYLHRELRRPGVTLQLLWVEYREDHPRDGLQYSQFCRHYRAWEGTIDVVMRQHHLAGEKAFVDFAGMTQGVVWTRRPGRCVRPRCSAPAWGPPATPTPKPSPTRDSQPSS
jgi:transposase